MDFELIKLLETYHKTGIEPLPVGTYISVPYKIDMDADPVNSQWQILGYNKSIP